MVRYAHDKGLEIALSIVTPDANPAERAAWKSAWSGTHFAGSWWR